jgi:hypothetical protein
VVDAPDCLFSELDVAVRYAVDDVFVTNDDPTVTYVHRDDAVEDDIAKLIKKRKKIVAISGPSKSGKTVMVRRVVSRVLEWQLVTISGSDLNSVDDFWRLVAHQVGVSSGTERSVSDGLEVRATVETGVNILPVTVKGTAGGALTDTVSIRKTRSVDLREATRTRLKSLNACIVIDDFHYAEESVRQQVARTLKDLLGRKVPIVLIAVPHHVLDLVQREHELVGRVARKKVADWDELELLRIANQGFEALRLKDAGGAISSKLVAQSFGSPLLMQELCGAICQANDIPATQDEETVLPEPADWNAFFTEVADETVQHPLGEQLLAGPQQRRPRTLRRLRMLDVEVDNYGAVFLALHDLMPDTTITLQKLTDTVNAILAERLDLQYVRRVCQAMEKASKEVNPEGDPAVQYLSRSPEKIVIADPYLAFFFAWGLGSLDLPVVPPLARRSDDSTEGTP